MKKLFFRTIRGGNESVTFKRDAGYLYTVRTPAGINIDMFIARSEYLKNKKLWTVTHGASGMIATITAYTTKKAAVNALYNYNYLCALDRLINTEHVKKYTALLSEHIAALGITT